MFRILNRNDMFTSYIINLVFILQLSSCSSKLPLVNTLEVVFGYNYSTYSKIVNYGLSLLYAKFGGRLEQFEVDLVLARLQEYQDMIRVNSNGAVNTCFGS